MELFVTLANGCQPLTNVIKNSILHVGSWISRRINVCIFFIITEKIFRKRINLYLRNNFQEFHFYPDTKYFLHEQPLVYIPTKTPDSILPLFFSEFNDFFPGLVSFKEAFENRVYTCTDIIVTLMIPTNSSMLLSILFCCYRSSNNSRNTLEKRLQRNSIFNKIAKIIKDCGQ